MKTSVVLTRARPYIKHYEFLCHAVDSVGYRNGTVTHEDTERVCEMISNRLGDSYTLNTWLEINHGITREGMSEDRYQKKMLKTRIAWCNSMIAEFETIGD